MNRQTTSHNEGSAQAGLGEPQSSRLPPDRSRTLLWLIAGLILVVAGARVVPYLPMPLPQCGLRALTGVPCMLCGSTRSVMACAHFEIGEAVRYNPLAAAGCVLFVAGVALYAVDCWLGRDWTVRCRRWLRGKPWPWWALAAAAINWVYLLFYLPK